MPMTRSLLFAAVSATAIGCASYAQAAVVLADELDDITVDGPQTSASIGAWDTVAGINAPSTTFTFQNGTDGTTTLTLRDDVVDGDVPDGEVFPNNNMTAGGWDTSIDFSLDGSTATIDLTSLVLDLRLGGSGGGNNNTGNKSGQVIAVLTGSSSGNLGSADLGGNQSYPSIEYVRTIDLTSLPTLDGSETYTLTIQARGTGFGHFKALQAVELNGDVTAIPEPGSLALMGLGGLMMIKRRRR